MDSICPPVYRSLLVQKVEKEIFDKEEEILSLRYDIYGLGNKHLRPKYQDLLDELSTAREELKELHQLYTFERDGYFFSRSVLKESFEEIQTEPFLEARTEFKVLKPQSPSRFAPCRPGFKSLSTQSPGEKPVIIAELKNNVAQLEVESSTEVKIAFAASEDVTEAQNVGGPGLPLYSSKQVDFIGVERYLQVSVCPRTTIQLAIFPRSFSEMKKIASRTRDSWVISLFLILPHFKIRGRIFSKKGRMVRAETLKQLGYVQIQRMSR